MLQKFRAARAAAKSPVAPVPTPAPPSGPATVESLGQQLREVLPARRLQSVSLCDHEANCLWLSEGALGPDEHMLVMESLEILAADSSLPCHETALEDGRLAVFLPVRAPMGSLVGVAMILADSKSVGDDTLERLTAAPVRTIMQRLAVLLKPNGSFGGPVQILDAAELPEPEVALEASEVPELPEMPEAAEATEPVGPMEASAGDLELAGVTEIEVGLPPAPAAEPEIDEISETIITAAEIANILELELVPDELPPTAEAAPVAAPASAKQPVKPAAPAPAASEIADSGMLRLEFLAEPPVVRPAPNPSAVVKKLQAASKAAEVAPTRAPRPLPAAPVQPARAAAPAAAPRAPAAPAAPARAMGPTPAAAPPPKATPAAAAPVKATPAAAPPVKATSAAAPPAKAPAHGPVRNPFEPVPAHSRLSLESSDDVVVLFESEPISVPTRPGAAPAKAPAPVSAVPAKPAQPTRAPATRITPPARTAPAVRTAPAPRPAAPLARPATAPAARTPPPAPPAPVAAAPAPAASAATARVPIVVPVVAAAPPPAPPPIMAAAPVAVPAAPAVRPAAETSPAIELVPFAKLRTGGQSRRFQVQPQDAALHDEHIVQQLLAWLAGNRSQWSSVPTSFTINLSIATLEDERFLQKVAAALTTQGIAGDTLGFEIAESLCVQQRAKVERFMAQCERIGAWVAIDDFSFDSQLLPLLRSKSLRMLKLDARLTAAALRDKLSQAMVVATVQAAKVLGIHCSAKKADSQASLQYLAAIGLDFAQGAALSRPVPLDAIATVTDARASGDPTSENL